MSKPSGELMGKPNMEKPSKGEMMEEKEGLCLSEDQVHMICGMGTNLQKKMDAALKQCMPMEMMAASMNDMQDMSMSPDIKLLSSGRAFVFEEPSAEEEKGCSEEEVRRSNEKDQQNFRKIVRSHKKGTLS